LRYRNALHHRGAAADRRDPARDIRALADHLWFRIFDETERDRYPRGTRDIGDPLAS
jgi:hypothetical protein